MGKRQDWHRTDGQEWADVRSGESVRYRCGYCGREVASSQGWSTHPLKLALIRLCPQCNAPTFLSAEDEQYPGPLLGGEVESLNDDVRRTYDEARNALTVGAATGTVMLCRKILMHVAVDKGAGNALSFLAYVEWLVKENWIPRGGQQWVEFIRKRGNEANHELPQMTPRDAEGILQFTELLLRNVYELPALVPPPPDGSPGEAGG